MEKQTNAASFVFDLRALDDTMLAIAGGKAANLGVLLKIEGINVPEGFCVSAAAYKRIVATNPLIGDLINLLSQLKITDRDKISGICREIRAHIEQAAIPEDIEEAIANALGQLGEKVPCAVRSSATAEDLPTASFAGQQDTYLNVIGKESVLKHISKCWASLFTDRAVFYRIQNGFDHQDVQLAVVVQKMIFPQAAGILFTADPVTSNRKVCSIDASFGLGEALVSGTVNPDVYTVSNGNITSKKISAKNQAIYATEGGGTQREEIGSEQQNMQALTDEQILMLERIGRKIEVHFAKPQDIEWCLANDMFYIVQSRPITNLFPVPETGDRENHVYVSVGHQQMMTDAMKPLGLSVRQLTGGRSMYEAAGRLFVDVAQDLASPQKRNILVNVLGKSDPLIKDALTTILERKDFIPLYQEDTQQGTAGKSGPDMPPVDFQVLKDYDPAIVFQLMKKSEAEIKILKERIREKSGVALIDFICEDILQLRKTLSDPQSFGVFMTAMNASGWINEKIEEWLGEKNVADTLTLSVANNVTSEMGLALIDVADVIRPYPELIGYLQSTKNNDFLNELTRFTGGDATRDAINAFLDKYGMRCPGEIDITRPRWSEEPAMLLPILLTNIRNLEPDGSQRKFEEGKQKAMKKEAELLDKLHGLSDGRQKATETKRMIDLVRNLIGYREYPKYHMVCCYYVYKQALLKEAVVLAQDGIVQDPVDIYYLSLEELREAIEKRRSDQQLIDRRKEAFNRHRKLSPPRIMTSDGEILNGTYKREYAPEGAIIGLAVSSGVAEGRARVITDMANAELEEGDILVTAFTDPSWTPLFVSIKGLVTEVGGLMTHGAVIAREYGLPAIVGVDNATQLIKDGQRIRVDGTEGYVVIL